MALYVKSCTSMLFPLNVISRSLSRTPELYTKAWRTQRGLSVNPNAEGVLTDNPDYTFLDGRPTPLLHKQKLRMEKNRTVAARIVQLNSELDFAIQRERQMQEAAEQERQRILNDRLKPKGRKLLK